MRLNVFTKARVHRLRIAKSVQLDKKHPHRKGGRINRKFIRLFNLGGCFHIYIFRDTSYLGNAFQLTPDREKSMLGLLFSAPA